MPKPSDELLDRLTEQARTDRKTSLKNIQRACDYLHEQGHPINPVSVAKYIASQPGGRPRSAQVIRNDPEGMLQYVRRRELERKGPVSSKAKADEPSNGEVDVSELRALHKDELIHHAALLQAEVRRLRAENNDIRAFVKTLSLNPNAPRVDEPPAAHRDEESNRDEIRREFASLLKLLSRCFGIDSTLTSAGVIFQSGSAKHAAAAIELLRFIGAADADPNA